jgi:hypothetical protein
MPMFLTASSAIISKKSALEPIRTNELAMDIRAIRIAYGDEKRNRGRIVGDSAPQVALRRKRHMADEVNISTRIGNLERSPYHAQTLAAWVFATKRFGPPVTYMRIIPLPVRSFV